MMTVGSQLNNSNLNPKDSNLKETKIIPKETKVLRLKWENDEEFKYRNNILSMSEYVSKVMEVISLGSIKDIDVNSLNCMLVMFKDPPKIYEKVNDYINNMLNSYNQAIKLLKSEPGDDLAKVFKAERYIKQGNAWLTITQCLFGDVIEGKSYD